MEGTETDGRVRRWAKKRFTFISFDQTDTKQGHKLAVNNLQGHTHTLTPTDEVYRETRGVFLEEELHRERKVSI